jgi:hypothetical protein
MSDEVRVTKALRTMAAEQKHWQARQALKLSGRRRGHKSDLERFCWRVMHGRNRTPFLDEVKQQVFILRLKGEL